MLGWLSTCAGHTVLREQLPAQEVAVWEDLVTLQRNTPNHSPQQQA